MDAFFDPPSPLFHNESKAWKVDHGLCVFDQVDFGLTFLVTPVAFWAPPKMDVTKKKRGNFAGVFKGLAVTSLLLALDGHFYSGE